VIVLKGYGSSSLVAQGFVASIIQLVSVKTPSFAIVGSSGGGGVSQEYYDNEELKKIDLLKLILRDDDEIVEILSTIILTLR